MKTNRFTGFYRGFFATITREVCVRFPPINTTPAHSIPGSQRSYIGSRSPRYNSFLSLTSLGIAPFCFSILSVRVELAKSRGLRLTSSGWNVPAVHTLRRGLITKLVGAAAHLKRFLIKFPKLSGHPGSSCIMHHAFKLRPNIPHFLFHSCLTLFLSLQHAAGATRTLLSWSGSSMSRSYSVKRVVQ